MSNNADVAVEAKSLSIIPGETLRIIVTVKNSGNTQSQFNFHIEGLDKDWYTLPVSSATLFPNDEEKLQITLHPPKVETVKPGIYNYHFITESQEYPNNFQNTPLVLEIKDIPECTLEIVPEISFGNTGTHRIIAHNKGETNVALQILVICLDAAFRYNLQPAHLNVPGKGTAESALQVRLGWLRFFRPKKKYDFTVFARQAGSGEVKTVNGQLVRFPEKKQPPVMQPPEIKSRKRSPDITKFESITEGKGRYKLVWETAHTAEVRLDNSMVELQGNVPVSPLEKTEYTLTAVNKYGTVNRTVTIEPPPVPKEKYSDRILVSLEPNSLNAAAGVGQRESTLEVQNTGSIVDKFSIEIDGLPHGWYSVSTPLVALMPHTKEQVRILLHPPKVAGVKSGDYPFAVIVHSQSVPDDYASTHAHLEILQSIDYSLAVKPYRLLCRRTCTFKIQLVNRDVSDAALFLDINDIENGLRFKIDNDSLVVPAWQSVTVPVTAKPKRNSIIGDIKRYDISINASTAEGLIQLARCQIDHKPLLSSWRPILRTLKYIIIMSIIAFIAYYVIRMGGGWKPLTMDPKTWLDGVIRHIRGWFY